MPARPPFVPAPNYDTALDPATELAFRQWVSDNRIPFDPKAVGPTDYDMRGYWLGLRNGNPMAAPSQLNQNDGQPHFPDYYKTPLHQSFSSESQWATPQAPQWINGSQLAAPNGRVIFDERSGFGSLIPRQE